MVLLDMQPRVCGLARARNWEFQTTGTGTYQAISERNRERTGGRKRRRQTGPSRVARRRRHSSLPARERACPGRRPGVAHVSGRMGAPRESAKNYLALDGGEGGGVKKRGNVWTPKRRSAGSTTTTVKTNLIIRPIAAAGPSMGRPQKPPQALENPQNRRENGGRPSALAATGSGTSTTPAASSGRPPRTGWRTPGRSDSIRRPASARGFRRARPCRDPTGAQPAWPEASPPPTSIVRVVP